MDYSVDMDVRDPLANLAYAVAHIDRVQATHDDALCVMAEQLAAANEAILILEARLELALATIDRLVLA